MMQYEANPERLAVSKYTRDNTLLYINTMAKSKFFRIDPEKDFVQVQRRRAKRTRKRNAGPGPPMPDDDSDYGYAFAPDRVWENSASDGESLDEEDNDDDGLVL